MKKEKKNRSAHHKLLMEWPLVVEPIVLMAEIQDVGKNKKTKP